MKFIFIIYDLGAVFAVQTQARLAAGGAAAAR